LKKFLAIIFIVLFLLPFQHVEKASASLPESSYTMMMIQNTLTTYLQNNGITYEVGSQEYLEYLISVLMEDGDPQLSTHPEYPRILFYAGQYVNEVEKHQLVNPDQKLTEDPNYGTFLLTTMAEIKQQNQMESQAAEEEIQSYRIANPDEVVVPGDSGSTYNRTAAANYAINWYNGRNSLYNSWSSDCTNFVSQAIHAGGKLEKRPSGAIPTGVYGTTSYWYSDRYSMPSYSYAWRESTPWIRVTDFYSYWAKTRSVTTSSSKSTIISNANLGDAVQLKRASDGAWFHTMIVTKKANGTIYLSGHTNNTLNKNISDISALSFRVIKF
jgi:Putative amidase domain